MLGFTLPLFIIMGLEGLVGVLLLCPKPVNQPAIQLARASYTQASDGKPEGAAWVLVWRGAFILHSAMIAGLQGMPTPGGRGSASRLTERAPHVCWRAGERNC